MASTGELDLAPMHVGADGRLEVVVSSAPHDGTAATFANRARGFAEAPNRFAHIDQSRFVRTGGDPTSTVSTAAGAPPRARPS
jgi:hypothetical protein